MEAFRFGVSCSCKIIFFQGKISKEKEHAPSITEGDLKHWGLLWPLRPETSPREILLWEISPPWEFTREGNFAPWKFHRQEISHCNCRRETWPPGNRVIFPPPGNPPGNWINYHRVIFPPGNLVVEFSYNFKPKLRWVMYILGPIVFWVLGSFTASTLAASIYVIDSYVVR